MFTGIVRERGLVVARREDRGGVRLTVEAPQTAPAAGIGDSVALNGVCLTVTELDGDRLAFDAVPETLARTAIGLIAEGSPVNIEPALRAADQLGGHFVQGHVDQTGAVRAIEPEGQGRRVWIDAEPDVLRYCVEKGSIAVDGVSLTIAALDANGFAVALVPHTLAGTTLGELGPGDAVNLEVDLLAKYVERLLHAS